MNIFKKIFGISTHSSANGITVYICNLLIYIYTAIYYTRFALLYISYIHAFLSGLHRCISGYVPKHYLRRHMSESQTHLINFTFLLPPSVLTKGKFRFRTTSPCPIRTPIHRCRFSSFLILVVDDIFMRDQPNAQ